jgi:hypothetical protein
MDGLVDYFEKASLPHDAGAPAMAHDTLRHYVVLKTNAEVEKLYFSPDRAEADAWAASYVAQHVYGDDRSKPPFETADRPSARVFGAVSPFDSKPEEVVVALKITGDEKSAARGVVDDIMKAATEKREIFSGSSTDIPFSSADHWCGAVDPIFANRSAAQTLIGVDYLRSQNGTDGQDVNVVIVDQGLDSQALGNSYGGGWTVGSSLPGTTKPPAISVRPAHAMMVAHNILKVAPKAKLFDLPLIPPRITDIPVFLSAAHAAVRALRTDIANYRKGKFPGPWIVVNAWSIYDRSSEYPPGDYTTNPTNPFTLRVLDLINDEIDVIFAAGNCGQFCPDGRCGGLDQGPGRSIWGANSLDPVISVGAVRSDGMWLGYSSQGPGQPLLGPNKPDFCASSAFHEDDDAFIINTGTSAACGLAAGVVAALRSRWDQTKVPPGRLKHVLNTTARKPTGLAWNTPLGYRLGNGILDAKAAFKGLP